MQIIKAAVNSAGVSNANARITAGDVDKTSEWGFTADDGSKLLGSDGKDWENFAKWHLGIDSNKAEQTRERYKYPIGKNGKVYRSGLIAIRARAAQQSDDVVYAKAGALIDKLDGKSARAPNVKEPAMRQMAWAKFELTKSYDAKDATADDNLDPSLENMYIVEGFASTPTPDRMGDIVEPDGCTYSLPLPYLWQHDSDAPIGNVVAVDKQSKGIWTRTAIPKVEIPGMIKDRIDNAIQSIKYKLVRGQSIGFAPVEYSYMSDTGGYHFLRWEWLELSAVTIPANSEASIATIKRLDMERWQRTHKRSAAARVVKLTGKTVSVGGIALPTEHGIKRYGQQHCDDTAAAMDEVVAMREQMLSE